MKSEVVYFQQVLECIQKIREFTSDMNYEQFFKDQKTQSAVIMQLTLIGELAKKVSDETKSYSSIPWKEIAGFRDRAVHDYYKIDLQVVWDTIADDLKQLEDALRKML